MAIRPYLMAHWILPSQASCSFFTPSLFAGSIFARSIVARPFFARPFFAGSLARDRSWQDGLWNDGFSRSGFSQDREPWARRHRHVWRSAWRRTRPSQLATVKESETAFESRAAALPGHVVTVQTAVGIPIRIAASVAPRFQGFISDLAAAGYRPRYINCHASSGHVRRSNHYWGGACDFDQSARGRTASAMRHVSELARKWGLRDGCTFRDCGHIDADHGQGGLRRVGFSRRRV